MPRRLALWLALLACSACSKRGSLRPDAGPDAARADATSDASAKLAAATDTPPNDVPPDDSPTPPEAGGTGQLHGILTFDATLTLGTTGTVRVLAGSFLTKILPHPRSASGHSVALFEHPKKVLRYASTYHFDTTTLLDFAGHAMEPLTFRTLPLPPLAPDGFEAAPVGPFAGGQVVDAQTLPPIAFGKSLFVPAACASRPVAPTTFRLALPAGAKTLQVVSRIVSGLDAPASITATALLGAEGEGPPVTLGFSAAALDKTDLPGGATGYLSRTQLVEPPLPPGAVTEVVVAISATVTAGCPSPPGFNGVLVDELRAH